MYMRTSFAAARTLGRDSFIMNMDDYSIVCFHDIIIYYMFPANHFGDSFAGNLRFAIFAINFFEHFKYLYFNTLSYKKSDQKSKGNSLNFNELPYYFSTKFDEEPKKMAVFLAAEG